MKLPDLVLVQPEIPPNSGNIIRLCANAGAPLHFVHPLGFRLDDARVRRAGLDYAEFARIHEHTDLPACLERIAPKRIFALTRHGDRCYADIRFGPDDALLFGPETTGLTAETLTAAPAAEHVRIPMRPQSRSMNLANSAAVVLFEAWRQGEFAGAAR